MAESRILACYCQVLYSGHLHYRRRSYKSFYNDDFLGRMRLDVVSLGVPQDERSRKQEVRVGVTERIEADQIELLVPNDVAVRGSPRIPEVGFDPLGHTDPDLL